VHFWQPKPSDIIAMEQADLIITNGLGLEEFLEDYLEVLNSQ
jgi:zinc transport system substrate-binding protein